MDHLNADFSFEYNMPQDSNWASHVFSRARSVPILSSGGLTQPESDELETPKASKDGDSARPDKKQEETISIISRLLKILLELFRRRRPEKGLDHSSSQEGEKQDEDEGAKGTEEPQQSPEVLLAHLPEEIIIDVMEALPPLSLWSLRQSAPVFLRLFDAAAFRDFHGDLDLQDPHIPFLRDRLSSDELAQAKNHLRKVSGGRYVEAADGSKLRHCMPCAAVLEKGEREPRMISLRKLHYCNGCKENHAGIFFPREDIEAYDRGGGLLNCLGRTGAMRLCQHESPGCLDWSSVEALLRKPHSDRNFKKACGHHSHMRLKRQGKSNIEGRGADGRLSQCPRLLVGKSLDKRAVEITFGWDLHLLDIDPVDLPSPTQIRHTVSDLLENAASRIRGLASCRHVLDNGELHKSAYSGICNCFAKPGNTHCTARKFHTEGLDPDCCCKRKQVLHCQECGGMYAWQVVGGRVILSYRYNSEVWKPTSPAWLSILDDLPHQGLDAHDKHLLWCDDPDCATSMGQRRLELIKEETWLNCARFSIGKTSPRADDIRKDFDQMWQRHAEAGSCYKIPQGITSTSQYVVGVKEKTTLAEIKLAAREARRGGSRI